MPKLERLWNVGSLAAWSEIAYFAGLLMATRSVLEAVHYLQSYNAPLSVARMILLGV